MGDDGSSAASTFKIMIASDIHLGYMEKDPVRGDDSFLAFEEVLHRAKECDVRAFRACARHGAARARRARVPLSLIHI